MSRKTWITHTPGRASADSAEPMAQDYSSVRVQWRVRRWDGLAAKNGSNRRIGNQWQPTATVSDRIVRRRSMFDRQSSRQRPLGLEADPERSDRCLSGQQVRHCCHFRMFTARATTMTARARLIADWTSISILAQRLSGMVSVGLKAVALVKDT